MKINQNFKKSGRMRFIKNRKRYKYVQQDNKNNKISGRMRFIRTERDTNMYNKITRRTRYE